MLTSTRHQHHLGGDVFIFGYGLNELLLQSFFYFLWSWQYLVEFIFCYTDWCTNFTQCVLCEQIIFLSADKQANAVVFLRRVEYVVNHPHIYCQLSSIREVKLGDFDFYDAIAVEWDYIKEEINVFLVSSCREAVLLSYEREASTEFDEKLTDVTYKLILELSLVILLTYVGKTEVVDAFDKVASKIGFGLWKGDIEICGCLSLCFVKVGGQHVFEHCTSPLVLKALTHEEEGFLLVAMDGINDSLW